MHYTGVATGRPARMATATWLTPEAVNMKGYGVMASPTLYPGQVLKARVEADEHNAKVVTCTLYLQHYGAEDTLERVYGPQTQLEPGADTDFVWTIPDTEGYPIAEVGLEISSEHRADGTVYLDFLTWDGTPEATFGKTPGGLLWRYAWVNGVDQFPQRYGDSFRLIHNEGTGLVIHGTRQWTDYRVCADVTPHMVKSTGLPPGSRGCAAIMPCS